MKQKRCDNIKKTNAKTKNIKILLLINAINIIVNAYS